MRSSFWQTWVRSHLSSSTLETVPVVWSGWNSQSKFCSITVCFAKSWRSPEQVDLPVSPWELGIKWCSKCVIHPTYLLALHIYRDDFAIRLCVCLFLTNIGSLSTVIALVNYKWFLNMSLLLYHLANCQLFSKVFLVLQLKKAGCLEPLEMKCISKNTVKAFQLQILIFSLAVQNTGAQGFQQALS